MMFNKISLIASLLFFLLGPNVFADSRSEVSSPQNNSGLSQTAQIITLNSDSHKIVAANKKTTTQREHAASTLIQEKDDQPSWKNYVIPVLVGLFFIFGLGSYWLIIRRKQT